MSPQSHHMSLKAGRGLLGTVALWEGVTRVGAEKRPSPGRKLCADTMSFVGRRVCVCSQMCAHACLCVHTCARMCVQTQIYGLLESVHTCMCVHMCAWLCAHYIQVRFCEYGLAGMPVCLSALTSTGRRGKSHGINSSQRRGVPSCLAQLEALYIKNASNSQNKSVT